MKKRFGWEKGSESLPASLDTRVNVMISLKKFYAECSKAGINVRPLHKLLSTMSDVSLEAQEQQIILTELLSLEPEASNQTEVANEIFQKIQWLTWILVSMSEDSLRVLKGQEIAKSSYYVI